jgi:hypothetical protein
MLPAILVIVLNMIGCAALEFTLQPRNVDSLAWPRTPKLDGNPFQNYGVDLDTLPQLHIGH